MIRKVFSNHGGSLLVSIPKEYTSEMGIDKNSYVNAVLVGTTLHLTKIVID